MREEKPHRSTQRGALAAAAGLALLATQAGGISAAILAILAAFAAIIATAKEE